MPNLSRMLSHGDDGGDRDDSDDRSSKDRAKSGLKTFGRALNQSSTDELRDISRQEIESMRKGGTVRKGKRVKLHRGEKAVRAKKGRKVGRGRA